MAVREIRVQGDDVLTKVCKEVKALTPRTLVLIEDMLDTMYEAQGVGLAAPQVGVLRRVCLVENDEQILELVNPEITYTSKETCIDNEGCLSVTEYRGIVRRPCDVTVKYFDRFGNECEISASGYDARVFMHEIDHLDGILFVDKMIKKVKA